MADTTIGQLPAASSADPSAVVAADNAAGTLTEKVTLGQIAALAGYDQSLNTTDIVTFNSITLSGDAEAESSGLTLDNGTQVTAGSFDTEMGGVGGVSLVCAVGYQLNWQASHLRNVFINDTTGTPLPIYCDSPIEFPGEGEDNVEISADGITFADGTTLTTADDPRWDSFLPNPPTGVTGVVSGNDILLSWSAPAGGSVPPITDYTIQYSDDDGATWATFADIVSTTTSATVTGLTSGNEYKFRVRAVNAIGLGALSAASAAVQLASPGVTLLLHFDGADEGAVFTNSAYTPLTITPYDAMTSTDQSKFGGASGYFDDARLTVVDDDGSPVEALSFGTGQFTVDFWVHVTGGSTYKNLLEFGTYGDYPATRFALTIYPNEQLQVENFAALLQDPTAFPTDEWVHVAVTRDSASMMRLFINGVVVDSDTVTQAFTANIASIGKQWSGESFTGWMDELRVVKGECLYTANFTPPTQPYADPVAPGLALLLHMDGPSDVTDSSPNALTFTTPPGSFNTTTKKFGNASYSVDSLQGLATTTRGIPSLVGVDWTVEAWVYRLSGAAAYACVVSLNGAADNSGFAGGLHLGVNADGSGYCNDGGSAAASSSAGAVPVGQWVHIAAVRSGGTTTLYFNGVADGTTSQEVAAGPYFANVGAVPGAPYSAFSSDILIDELRIVAGTAVYTTNFTPSTAPHSNPPPPPALLLHMDGANESTTFTDSSANNWTVTPSGGAAISTTQSKFGGASMYLDGTGAEVTASASIMDFGAGDFTVDCWLYLLAEQYHGVVGSGAEGGCVIGVAADGSVLCDYRGAGTGVTSSAGATSVNSWQHLAVTRSSGAVKIFVNGVAVATGTMSAAFSAAATTSVGSFPGPVWLLNGYMDELRIIKGYAAYTTNFTPPTAPY
jgi:hypothetical protein